MNLLNSMRKRDKMLGKPHILSLFLNSFNKFQLNMSTHVRFYISFTDILKRNGLSLDFMDSLLNDPMFAEPRDDYHEDSFLHGNSFNEVTNHDDDSARQASHSFSIPQIV